jgi:hypothetical protein
MSAANFLKSIFQKNNPVENILDKISLGESQKVYWLNKNSIKTCDVAGLDALRDIKPKGYFNTFMHNQITNDDFE